MATKDKKITNKRVKKEAQQETTQTDEVKNWAAESKDKNDEKLVHVSDDEADNDEHNVEHNDEYGEEHVEKNKEYITLEEHAQKYLLSDTDATAKGKIEPNKMSLKELMSYILYRAVKEGNADASKACTIALLKMNLEYKPRPKKIFNKPYKPYKQMNNNNEETEQFGGNYRPNRPYRPRNFDDDEGGVQHDGNYRQNKPYKPRNFDGEEAGPHYAGNHRGGDGNYRGYGRPRGNYRGTRGGFRGRGTQPTDNV